MSAWLVLPAEAVNGRNGSLAGAVWMNGQKQPVAQAIVYLGGVGLPTPADAPPVVLDQQRDQFVPRIQLARAGAPLIIQNSDPYLHVVRVEVLKGGEQPRVWLRVATPYAGFEKRYALPAVAEATLLRACGENGHERMVAYIAVLPHPWAALTDARGQFQIGDVPAGDYRIYAWHEKLGTLAGRVRVVRGRATEVQFDFPRPP
jgi:hypothetical protein